MTSEHDRLLAQGPRTAPEPLAVDGFASPAPAEQPATAPGPVEKPPLVRTHPGGSARASGSGSWLTLSPLRSLIPLVLVLTVAARGFAGGHSGSWVLAVIWIVAAVVVVVLRTRGRRPW